MTYFKIQIAETRNYEFEVLAETNDQARDIAMKIWRESDTVGQWEIPDTGTEIVAVIQKPEKAA